MKCSPVVAISMLGIIRRSCLVPMERLVSITCESDRFNQSKSRIIINVYLSRGWIGRVYFRNVEGNFQNHVLIAAM